MQHRVKLSEVDADQAWADTVAGESSGCDVAAEGAGVDICVGRANGEADELVPARKGLGAHGESPEKHEHRANTVHV